VEDEDGLSPFAAISRAGESRLKAALMAIQHLVRLVALVLFGLALAVLLGVLLLGVPQVLQNAVDSGLGDAIFIMAPMPVGIVYLKDYPLLAYYLFLVSAIVASMAYLLYSERRELQAGLRKAAATLRAPDRLSFRLGLVQLPQVFLAVLFFDYLYAIVLALTGTSPNVPGFAADPLWYQLFLFARASVWEEIAARVLLCGLPLLAAYCLAYLVRGPWAPTPATVEPAPGPPVPCPSSWIPGAGQAAPRAPAQMTPAGPAGPSPPRVFESMAGYVRGRSSHGLWGYVLGGGFSIGPLEAFFIVGSALMFGYAHVPSWDMWKLLPTFIAGLGFAYLFLRVGIHAAILLHFSFDYLGMAVAMLPAFDTFYSLVALLWVAVGAFYFAHYALGAAKWASAAMRGAPAPPGGR